MRVTREQCFDLNRGNRRNTADVALLITDGFATVDAGNTMREAELLKGEGVYLLAVSN